MQTYEACADKGVEINHALLGKIETQLEPILLLGFA
jgi:hypothetical protein